MNNLDKSKYDFTIKDIEEEIPVGAIIYGSREEEYFNEKELINDYENVINTMGANINCQVYSTSDNPRHGLSYRVSKAIYNEYGDNYTEEYYIINKLKDIEYTQGMSKMEFLKNYYSSADTISDKFKDYIIIEDNEEDLIMYDTEKNLFIHKDSIDYVYVENSLSEISKNPSIYIDDGEIEAFQTLIDTYDERSGKNNDNNDSIDKSVYASEFNSKFKEILNKTDGTKKFIAFAGKQEEGVSNLDPVNYLKSKYKTMAPLIDNNDDWIVLHENIKEDGSIDNSIFYNPYNDTYMYIDTFLDIYDEYDTYEKLMEETKVEIPDSKLKQFLEDKQAVTERDDEVQTALRVKNLDALIEQELNTVELLNQPEINMEM